MSYNPLRIVTVTVQEQIETNANLIAISHRKEPEMGIFNILDGISTLETTTHNQSFFLSYDGMLADSGYYLIPSVVEPISATGLGSADVCYDWNKFRSAEFVVDDEHSYYHINFTDKAYQ